MPDEDTDPYADLDYRADATSIGDAALRKRSFPVPRFSRREPAREAEFPCYRVSGADFLTSRKQAR